MSLDQEKFNHLKTMADNAYRKINGARYWIVSLKDKAFFPDSWETISDECDLLLNDIMVLVDTEKQELEKKEKSR